MPTAFKSAKAYLRPAWTDAIEAWLAAEEAAADQYHAALYSATQVVYDESSDAGPPAIRLQQPTEATDIATKSDIYSELTDTVRITANKPYDLDHLAGSLRERFSMALDGSHRIDMTEHGFKVMRQNADMQDNPLSTPTETGVVLGTMQRYRFLVRPI